MILFEKKNSQKIKVLGKVVKVEDSDEDEDP
jgi:hypothetical protein